MITADGTVSAHVSGALQRTGRLPAVGDFVVLLWQPEEAISLIVDILPRKSVFTRGLPGRDGADQPIAANIDLVFIVTAAGPDLNPRRLERYLALVNASGARPVILVNKADLAEDPKSLARSVTPVAAGVPVVVISAVTGSGLSGLDPHLAPGTTVALIGSSGVGKSTLINALLGRAVQETACVRDHDGKGRHRTSVRQMFLLDSGALVIDNPGLREVGLGTAGGGLDDTFPEIVELASGCRYSDCSHEGEPGCAVREAVDAGLLPRERHESLRQARQGTRVRTGEGGARAGPLRTKALEGDQQGGPRHKRRPGPVKLRFAGEKKRGIRDSSTCIPPRPSCTACDALRRLRLRRPRG